MMPASLWSDPGTWIALGISALFLVAAWVMHRVFLKVLKAQPTEFDAAPSQPAEGAAQIPGAPFDSPAGTRPTRPPESSPHERHP